MCGIDASSPAPGCGRSIGEISGNDARPLVKVNTRDHRVAGWNLIVKAVRA